MDKIIGAIGNAPEDRYTFKAKCGMIIPLLAKISSSGDSYVEHKCTSIILTWSLSEDCSLHRLALFFLKSSLLKKESVELIATDEFFCTLFSHAVASKSLESLSIFSWLLINYSIQESAIWKLLPPIENFLECADALAINFLGPMLDVLLHMHPRPRSDAVHSFLLVNLFALSSVTSWSADSESLFRAVTEAIGSMFERIWIDDSDGLLLLQFLNAVFAAISVAKCDADIDKTALFGPIVKRVPINGIHAATQMLILSPDISVNSLVTVLRCMFNWLRFPESRGIKEWILSVLRDLAVAGRFSVLVEVSRSETIAVFELLSKPGCGNDAFSVLVHMQTSYQHSPEIFHQICPEIPRMLVLLSDSSYSSLPCSFSPPFTSMRLADNLALLSYILIQLHPGFPELYEPILSSAPPSVSVPSTTAAGELLSRASWIPRIQGDTYGSNGSFAMKAVVGVTGLVNLGNT